MLAYGFVRARCEDCGTSRAIAFSCKRRGFCPSYSGRRMADTAARLADDVLPRVPVRQWVLSFPYEIRYRLAYDGELVATVLAVFLCVVGRWYRRQAQALGHDSARCGSVTFVQRFGSSLNLNPHLHVLMLDGVYVDGDEAPVFVPAPPLSDQDVQQIVQTSTRRILRLCAKRGLLDRHRSRSAADEEPVLAALTAASVGGLLATGERAGQPRATCPERCGHRGAYGALVRCFARLFAACGDADRGPGPAGARTLVPLRGPTGPGGGASTHPRFPAPLLRAQNAVVGWDQPPGTVSPGTAGKTGSSRTPAAAPSPPLPRGLGALCPGPRPHRARQAGCGVAGCGRRSETSALRPSVGLGGPARAGVCRRAQPMRRLWRSPEDHRRLDRSGLDPSLSGGGRPARPSPVDGAAEGTPPAAPFEFAA